MLLSETSGTLRELPVPHQLEAAGDKLQASLLHSPGKRYDVPFLSSVFSALQTARPSNIISWASNPSTVLWLATTAMVSTIYSNDAAEDVVLDKTARLYSSIRRRRPILMTSAVSHRPNTDRLLDAGRRDRR